MTTDVPDWYELGERVSEPFNLARVSITGGSETAETLGQFLFHGLTNTDHLNQSQGGMCICRVLGIGAGVSRECFGP